MEASLDVILKERLVVVDDEDEDDDEEDVGDPDERGDSPLRVLPKQPGEFVCQSCFLVKHPSQLADDSPHALPRLRMTGDWPRPPTRRQDRIVSERSSRLDALLDLFVYAPVGLALAG